MYLKVMVRARANHNAGAFWPYATIPGVESGWGYALACYTGSSGYEQAQYNVDSNKQQSAW